MAVVETENAFFSDLSTDELADEIAILASHIYAGTCRWLELVAELDRRGGFSGCTVEQYLAWRCALTPRTAREHVRVARALSELPLIHEAFARGELSYAKVRALTRVANDETEEELLELARSMTASQLERAVRAYRYVTAAEANDLQSLAYVGYSWEEDGSLTIRAKLAPEDGALFLRALEAARDRLQERAWDEERGSAEPRAPRRPTNAEALVAVADLALSEGSHGRTGGERYQVVVHVEAEGGTPVLEDGPALSEETARRIACDASLVELVERDGEPLSVGRKRRTIPPSIRRALEARDRCCQFPGCDNRRFLHAHHIEHWSEGGETKLSNLVLLCPRHHPFLHEAGYSVIVLADGFQFRDPWGNPIHPVPRPPPGDRDWLLQENDELEIGAWTCECGDGDPMDLDLAVKDLIQIVGSAPT